MGFPSIANLFKKSAEGATGGILKGAADIIGKFVADPTEKAKALAELEQAKIKHEEEMAKIGVDIERLELEKDKAYLADMDSARKMQAAALQQGDVFSRRFIYYFTIGLTLATMIYDFCFFFVSYPERNHDVVNMIAGVLNTGCLVSIINFFYGSSKSSEKKQDMIERMNFSNKS
jgi:hypothetical protein